MAKEYILKINNLLEIRHSVNFNSSIVFIPISIQDA